jgi:3D (Asp-Asp-Asp) domain-containing protein
LAGILLATSLSSGCATVVKGTSQKVPIASDPTTADVIVDGNLMGQTPTTLKLKRKTDHLITVQKTGFQPKSVAVVKDVGGAVWGNILAGGLIGWGVDAASGAQYNLVPSTVSLKLDPTTAGTVATGKSEQEDFIEKLKSLDQLHEQKQVSDEEYGKARLELFKRYMPEALPKDNRATDSGQTTASN